VTNGIGRLRDLAGATRRLCRQRRQEGQRARDRRLSEGLHRRISVDALAAIYGLHWTCRAQKLHEVIADLGGCFVVDPVADISKTNRRSAESHRRENPQGRERRNKIAGNERRPSQGRYWHVPVLGRVDEFATGNIEPWHRSITLA
jgi:hypothetical protein